MAARSFSSAAQEMSTSQSSGSHDATQLPVDAISPEEEQTYGSASEIGSESSVGGNWGTEGDLDPSLSAELPMEENLLVLVRTAQSLQDDMEQEMKLQRSSVLSTDHQNLMPHADKVDKEKALGISTQLSVLMKVVEAWIKDKQLRNETELHEASMGRKEAERATKETMAQMELLKLEHERTLLSKQSEYQDSLQGLEAELAMEQIKSAAIEQRLKKVEALLLAKSDETVELDAKLQDKESKRKDLEIMKSVVERRLQREPKRRKRAVKTALDSAEAELSRRADSFKKMFLKSALDRLKLQYPNIDFSIIENGDLLGNDDPQPSRVPPITAQKIASESKSES